MEEIWNLGVSSQMEALKIFTYVKKRVKKNPNVYIKGVGSGDFGVFFLFICGQTTFSNFSSKTKVKTGFSAKNYGETHHSQNSPIFF